MTYSQYSTASPSGSPKRSPVRRGRPRSGWRRPQAAGPPEWRRPRARPGTAPRASRFREECVDRLRCACSNSSGVHWRRDAVVELDLVLERDLCSASLRAAVSRPTSCASSHVRLVFEAVERVVEASRVLRQRVGRARLLGVDPLLDLRRPVVRVDEPVQVPAETEPKLDVLDRRRRSSLEERGLALADADAERRQPVACRCAAGARGAASRRGARRSSRVGGRSRSRRR